MSKYGANLPSVLNPVGDMCVRVYIPNHPDYIKLFVRAIRMLEVNRMYERDENLSAKIVCEQWRDRTITPLIEALATGTGTCDDLDGECLTYPPFANFITYYPQNPYTQPDYIPDGFEQPPFYVNGKDPAHDLPNYEKGDVILDFGSINIEPSWNLEKTPRIELCVEGSGVAEIHFLNIAQGGVAIISLDNPVDLGDIIAGIIGDGIESIDLNQDIVSLPPETASEIIIEVEVPIEGEHIIYIYFLPVVNDSLIPLSFGGGLREISLCGNLRPCGVPEPEPPPPLDGVTELKPEFQFTPDCGLEYRLRDQEDNIVQDWQPVPGWVENAADCFGGGSMATKDDIRDGIYEAANRIAAQIISGRYTNISVDDEGTVSDPSESETGVELPEDDPATDYNESDAAYYGGTISLSRGLELFYDKLDAYYGNVNNSPGIDAAESKFRIKTYFPCDEATMDAAIDNYYLYRQTNGRIDFNTSSSQQLWMFCHGATERGWAQWLIDQSGYPANKLSVVNLLSVGLAEEFWTSYFNEGVDKPDTHYLDASCVPVATQTLENLLFGVSRNTNPLKSQHRMEMTCTGLATDTAGNTQDWFWFFNNTTKAVTRQNPTFTHSAGANLPSDNQIVYNAAHKYVYTIDLAALNNIMVIQTNKHASLIAAGLVYNTPFNITLRDLGEYTV